MRDNEQERLSEDILDRLLDCLDASTAIDDMKASFAARAVRQLRADLKAAQDNYAHAAEACAGICHQLHKQRDALQARIDAAPEYWAVFNNKGTLSWTELLNTKEAAEKVTWGNHRVARVRLLEIPEPPTPEEA